MLLIRTYLDRSPIHGIGVFASEAVPAGTVVWVFAPSVDRVLRTQDVAALPLSAREQVEKYAYLDMRTGELILCGDDARFFNHADVPNVIDDADDPYRCIAARDIMPGEELLCDYREFDRSADEKLGFASLLPPP